MMENGLSEAQVTLRRVLACALRNQHYNYVENIDYLELYKESMLQAVLLQTICAIDVNKIPDNELKKIWTNTALSQIGVNLQIHSYHNYVHNLLNSNNIKYCILKGSASASFYPRPSLRLMGDVDFLVDPSDVKKVSQLLILQGFSRGQNPHKYHIVFQKEKMHLEMHFKPFAIPSGAPGVCISNYLQNIFAESEKITMDNITFMRPSLFHHGLILLMHMYGHLLNSGVGLRHLSDWAVFVNSFTNNDFEQIFKSKLTNCGLWDFAQTISCLAHKYLEIPYQKWMGNVNEKLLDSLIADINSSGNFGCKDSDRSRQGLAITNQNKDTISDNKIAQLIYNANAIAENKFPKMSKMPVLKHLGMPLLIGKYFFKICTGQRAKVNFPNLLAQAEKRKKIYQQLHVFKITKK